MIRHQIVDEGDLKADFQEHTDRVRDLKELSNETKLEFYGLYKQAMCGKCDTNQPGMFDFRGRAKWEAWHKLGDLSKADAMLMYIDLFNSLDESDLKAGGGEDAEEGTVKVSTLFNPEDEEASRGTVWYACRHGNLSDLQSLLSPATLNITDEECRTPLHWAVDQNHLATVRWLLAQGCDRDSQDSDGSTALHYAVTCEHVEVVRVLLEGGARADVKDGDGCTARELCETEELRACFEGV